jgi:hypothetical protein
MMTRTEIARMGGQALAAKVSKEYFAWLGRRGGRNNMARELRELAQANQVKCPTMAEHYQERAQGWAVDTGTLVMVELWTTDNCPARPTGRPANGDITKLRRWNKANKN